MTLSVIYNKRIIYNKGEYWTWLNLRFLMSFA